MFAKISQVLPFSTPLFVDSRTILFLCHGSGQLLGPVCLQKIAGKFLIALKVMHFPLKIALKDQVIPLSTRTTRQLIAGSLSYNITQKVHGFGLKNLLCSRIVRGDQVLVRLSVRH